MIAGSGLLTARTMHALALAVVLFGCATETPSAPAPISQDATDQEQQTSAAEDPLTPPRPEHEHSDARSDPDSRDTDRPADPADGPAAPRPSWLGTRALPLAPDGFGERLPTPPELVDRRLRTPPLPEPAPPQPRDDRFAGTVSPVPTDVATRSTWTSGCPIGLEDLRYVTVHHYGFDGQVHVGELIVAATVAEDVVRVFAALHDARFPLEEVRVISQKDLSAPATGDGNVTSAFVCRPTVGGSRWSEHAFGRAIDVNPFHNPYVRGDLVIPELAGSYVDRSDLRPGMIVAGDVVTAAFAAIGWGWGGDWTGPATDPMHFSVSGR